MSRINLLLLLPLLALAPLIALARYVWNVAADPGKALRIALGFDRLIMLATGAPRIAETSISRPAMKNRKGERWQIGPNTGTRSGTKIRSSIAQSAASRGSSAQWLCWPLMAFTMESTPRMSSMSACHGHAIS
jgi:hypothetical protein